MRLVALEALPVMAPAPASPNRRAGPGAAVRADRGAGRVRDPVSGLAVGVDAAVRRALGGEPIVAAARAGHRPSIVDVVTATRTARIVVHADGDGGCCTAHVAHAIAHDDVHVVHLRRNSAVITHLSAAVPAVVVAGRLSAPLREALQGRRSGER